MFAMYILVFLYFITNHKCEFLYGDTLIIDVFIKDIDIFTLR